MEACRNEDGRYVSVIQTLSPLGLKDQPPNGRKRGDREGNLEKVMEKKEEKGPVSKLKRRKGSKRKRSYKRS